MGYFIMRLFFANSTGHKINEERLVVLSSFGQVLGLKVRAWEQLLGVYLGIHERFSLVGLLHFHNQSSSTCYEQACRKLFLQLLPGYFVIRSWGTSLDLLVFIGHLTVSMFDHCLCCVFFSVVLECICVHK